MKKYLLNNNFEELILKYNFYLLPIFFIIGNAFINMSMIIVSLIYIILCIKNKRFLYLEEFELKIFFFLYFYLVINSLFSEYTEDSFIRSLFYIKFILFYLVYKNFLEKKNMNLSNLGFFWSIIIFFLSCDVIFQSFVGFNIFGYSTGTKLRNSGLFFDELIAGGFLVGFSFIALSFLKNKKKNFFLILLLTFLTASFLTGERSNFIKFIILFFSLNLYYYFNKENLFQNKFFSLICFAIVSLILFLSYDKIRIRLVSDISFIDSSIVKENISFKDKYFTSAYGSHSLSSFYVFKDNILFGVGTKNFRNECNKYEEKVKNFQKKISSEMTSFPPGCSTHPHQTYNELLSEHGLIGTFIILFMFGYLVFKRIKNKNINSTNFISLIFILLIFIPLLPNGSLFTTNNSVILWTNILFLMSNLKSNTN